MIVVSCLQESLSSFNTVVKQLAQDTGYDNLSDKVMCVVYASAGH